MGQKTNDPAPHLSEELKNKMWASPFEVSATDQLRMNLIKEQAGKELVSLMESVNYEALANQKDWLQSTGTDEATCLLALITYLQKAMIPVLGESVVCQDVD